MHISNERLDFPAQCHTVKRFEPIPVNASSTDHEIVPRVLIVTDEICIDDKFDPALCLSAALLRNAIEVSLIYTSQSSSVNHDLLKTNTAGGSQAIEIIKLPYSVAVLQGPVAEVLEASYQFHHWLQQKQDKFTSIVSLCSPSILYYSLLGRQTAIAHKGTNFYVHAASSGYFDVVKHCQPVVSPKQLNLFYAERKSIELADAFISNSQHYLNWMHQNECGDSIPACYLHEIPMPDDCHSLLRKFDSTEKTEDFVFLFGDNSLVEMKLCADAFDRLNRAELSAIFLVPHSVPNKVLKSLRAISNKQIKINRWKSESTDWMVDLYKARIVVIPAVEQISGALKSYLKATNCNVVANDVMGSDAKNSELVMRVFNHNPEWIKCYLENAMNNQGASVAPAHIDYIAAWRNILSNHVDEPLDHKSPADELKVSVCIAHYNRGKLLQRAIHSILEQSRPCQEIIVVDDGSTDPLAMEVLDSIDKLSDTVDIRVVRQPNLFIGASRNKGLEAARGDYILFMDDDNEAMPNELEVFVECANSTGADILTCFSKVFAGESPDNSNIGLPCALFVGANLSAGLISNPFGDSNMFVRASAVRKIRGFSEHFKAGRDDQEFFVRASLSGLDIQLIPKPLFYYRLSRNRIRQGHLSNYSGLARVIAPYSAHMTIWQTQLTHYIQGVSYANGPWGVSLRYAQFRSWLIESARVYVARFPSLYAWLTSTKK